MLRADDFQRSVTRGIAWTAIAGWGSAAVTLATTVLLARLLGPEAFGLVALAAVYVGFARIFVEQGFALALVQRRTLEPEHLDSAFWVAVVAGVSLAALSLSIAPSVARALGAPALAPIIRWLSLGLVLHALYGTQEAVLQRGLAFRTLAIRSLVATTAGGIAGLGAAILGFGVWSLVVQALMTAAVGTAVLWSLSSWRPGLRFSARHFRDLFGFSTYTFGTALLNVISRRVDDLLIGRVLGPVALGYYTVAYELVKAGIDLLTGVATKVALPAFSRLQHEPARVRNGLYTATRYSSLIAVPAFVGLILVAPEFVHAFYGGQWSPSIPVLQILAAIGVLHAAFYFNSTVMLAAGKASWRFVLTLLAVIGNVVAFLIAVRWGLAAVAAAFVVRAYLLSPLPLLALRRLIGLEIGHYLRQYRVPLVGAALMAGGVLLLKSVFPPTAPIGVQLGAYVVAGVLLYGVAVYGQEPYVVRDFLGLLRRPAEGPRVAGDVVP